MIKKLLAEFLGTMFFLYVILATGDAVAIGLAFDEGWFDPNEESAYKGIGDV